ncbi:MAG: ATP-dependent RecD-like DNA helicase [Oscillospiraceae bacterium]|nr:ATP-dependent RecD-like DNA helicase [Oscillospiraceae bacterium]
MTEELEILQGVVQSVTFQNPENGYTILRLASEECGPVTVVGTIPMAVAGERLMVTGKWITHPTYGKQFEAEFLERLMPAETDEILAFLSSRAVKGIGPATAKKLVDAFGARTLDVLENHPEELALVEGFSRKKAFAAGAEFRRQVSVRRLIEFLSAHQLPADLAVRLYRSYGDAALDAIREDPYLMADPLFGAPFSAVDNFAMELGVAADDDSRVEAGVLFELSHNLGNGHVFIPWDKLTSVTSRLLDLPPDTVEAGMDRLCEQERMTSDTLIGRTLCYLPEWHDAETFVAERLKSLSEISDKPAKNLDALLEKISSRLSVSYAPDQSAAIRAAATSRLLTVTGGPGTGKTTTMAGILELYDILGIETLLAAPTGRAAKRLTELTGREAATIHRLLQSQYDPESGSMLFIHDETEPLQADAIIIDEASMMDLMLMSALLRAMKPHCRLILVGDPDQLPSVGAGNVLSDILRSGVGVSVRLTEIFRQAQQSLIVMNAHAINGGEMPNLSATDRDFFFLRRMSGEAVAQTIRDLCAVRLPGKMGIAPEEIQVLSPTRKGAAGTGELNRVLQAALNPKTPQKREKIYGAYTYREGDRVMQIRNNYDLPWRYAEQAGSGTGIFNGEIGLIEAIDPSTDTITIRYDDKLAEYGTDQLSELEPAYAMTVHKSQGSEYRAVVLSAFGASPLLLTRSVLYTAVTRARELLIIVGSEDTIAAMVQNDKQQRRYSGLKLRLEDV